MVFRADAEWARAYMKKKGRPAPPDLPATPPMTGACKVPEMADGEPCRRCGSGLPGYRISLCAPEDEGPGLMVDSIWVCEECETQTAKRIMRRGRGDE